MTLRQQILKRLEEVGFRTGEGSVSPFGQPLPLVTAWAVEDRTAALGLIVEDPDGVADDGPWRELLFALSGIRHELRDGGAPALGTPVAIALLERKEHAQRLRRLVENMSAEYILFSRVELNVVALDEAVDIDRALSPLLPRCRSALAAGTLLGKEALATLEEELRSSVIALAETLDEPLRKPARSVALAYAQQLGDLVSIDESAPFNPVAWSAVQLNNFRSFADGTIPLATLTLLEGLNGTGKSSIVEALEILWSGTSQRKPADETAEAYDKALARDGSGQWRVTGVPQEADNDPVHATKTEATASGEAARNVFSQDGSADIAHQGGGARYEELLRITGLSIPELEVECERLNRAAKSELDNVLSRLAIPGLQRITTRATDHVRDSLAQAAKRLAPPPMRGISDLQRLLSQQARESNIEYEPLVIDEDLSGSMSALIQRAEQLAMELRSDKEFVLEVRTIHERVRGVEEEIGRRARALDALVAAMSVVPVAVVDARLPVTARVGASALPGNVAAKWLDAGNGLRDAVAALRSIDNTLEDAEWTRRISKFLEMAESTLELVPFAELEREVDRARAPAGGTVKKTKGRVQNQPRPPAAPLVDEAAGFRILEGRQLPLSLRESLIEVATALRDYSNDLARYRGTLLATPLVQLEGLEDELLLGLARFELAKRLKTPLAATQAGLVSRLISGPLEPLLVELIAALTRFEWYFHPFKMSMQRGTVRLAGLATSSAEMDVRMLLNSGERAIVTMAWFLALHLLQPEPKRRVLILDDPFSVLDENNQAALIATVRSFARLTKPELLLFTSHDRIVSDAIEREFAAVADWPSTVARIRFSRTPDGTSTVDGHPTDAPRAEYERELSRLGLDGVAQLAIPEAR